MTATLARAEPRSPNLVACLEHLASLRDRLCPRQVLGVRMGLYAGELLDVELPRRDKRLFVFVETDGCFADGISVATDCWLGHRTLRLMDYGKVAATFADTRMERAIRVWPDPLARLRARDYAPPASSRWEAQLIGYQRMTTHELLRSQSVDLGDGLATIISRPGLRVPCAGCGEEIMNEREVRRVGRAFCRGCAGRAYYRPIEAPAPPLRPADASMPPATCYPDAPAAERIGSGGRSQIGIAPAPGLSSPAPVIPIWPTRVVNE